MMKRHSLFTRCLAVLLAMVLIASNASGLALGVQAAEVVGADLYTLIQKSGNFAAANMGDVLPLAGAMKNLTNANVDNIAYEEEPNGIPEGGALLRNGTLTVDAIGAWIPATSGEKQFVAIDDDTYQVTGLPVGPNAYVTFEQVIPGWETKIQAIADEIYVVADGIATTSKALQDIIGGSKLDYMQDLTARRIQYLAGYVDELELSVIGVDTSSMTEVEIAQANLLLEEVRNEMDEVLAGLLARTEGKYLRVYNMLLECQDGISYYYRNDGPIKEELTALQESMNALLYPTGDYADYMNKALDYILNEEGFSRDTLTGPVDKISAAITELNNAITFPLEDYVNMDHENADALIDALDNVVHADYSTTLVLEVGPFEVVDDTYWKINFAGIEFETIIRVKGEKLDDTQILKIREDIEAKYKHHIVTIDEDALRNATAEEDITVQCSATPESAYYEFIGYNAEPTNKIIYANEDEIVLEVPNGIVWTYEVIKNGSVAATGSTAVENGNVIKVDPTDMDLIFDGQYTIKITDEIDTIKEKLLALVAAVNGPDGINRADAFALEGTSLTANITINELEPFIKQIVKEKENAYLNGELFIDGQEETISMQVLTDALLAEGFDDDAIKKLAADGKGALLDDATITIYGRELDFTLNLIEVPAEMDTASDALAELEGYMEFDTENGEVNIKLTLPEKVYELYLTKTLAESEVKKDNAKINSAVAMEYMIDTLAKLIDEGADADAFKKVMAAAGKNMDLTDEVFNEFFDAFAKVITSSDMEKATQIENGITAVIDASKDTMGSLMGQFGFGKYQVFLADENVAVTVNITLTNEAPNFQAVVVAPKAEGMMNKVDYTTSLSAVNGPAAVVLLDNVGSLSFNGNAILDLNGKTVNGDITVTNGTLYIVDSLLGNASCGAVTGNVSGNAVIMGGKFGGNVSGMLKAGYIQKDDGTVQNAMYTLSTSGITLNKDFFTKANLKNYEDIVKSTAVDLAADLILNGYRFSSVNYDGQSLFAAEYIDLLGLLKDKDVEGLIGQTVGNIGAAGISKLANDIIADLLDFDAVAAAVEGDGVIATYPISANHWDVDVRYDDGADYITADLKAADTGFSKNIPLNVSKLPDTVKEYAVKALREMAAITNEATVTVTLNQPTYSNKTLSVSGSATAVVDVDVTVSNYYKDVYLKVLATAVAKGDADKAAELMADPETLKAEFDATTVEGVVNALMSVEYSHVEKAVAKFNEKFNKNVDISAYADKIEWAIDKAKAYGEKLINKLSDKVMSAKVGDFEIEDGVYGKEGANADAGPKYINGFKDYRFNHGVELTLEESTATVKVKLFGTEKDMGYLFLDLNPLTGKTLAELERSLVIEEFGEGATLSIKNADDASYTGIAKTGMKVAITSGNKTLNYTLIVLGDTNKDGKTTSADTSWISFAIANQMKSSATPKMDVDSIFESLKAAGIDCQYEQVLAADAGMNNKISSADTSRISNKLADIMVVYNPMEPDSEAVNTAWNTWLNENMLPDAQF